MKLGFFESEMVEMVLIVGGFLASVDGWKHMERVELDLHNLKGTIAQKWVF